MLKLRVRHVLGVRQAEVGLEGINLIAGRNAAGKSSLLEALVCVALGEHAARGVTKKKDGAAIVHEASDIGSATLDWGTGQQRMVWPEGNLETVGEVRAGFGSALAIGATRWSRLDAKARAAEFSVRMKAEPGEEDLRAFLVDAGGDPEAAGPLYQRVLTSGWDAVHAKARETATEYRGAWQKVAGTTFGSEKAAKWRPASLLPDEPYTVEATQQELAEAKARLERLLEGAAVDGAEVARLQAEVADLEKLRAKDARLEAELAELDDATEKLLKERNALPAPPAPGEVPPSWPCPHCSKPLTITRDANNRPTITAFDAGKKASREQLQRAAAAYTAADDAWSKSRRLADAKRSESMDLRATLKAKLAAEKRLADLDRREIVPADQVAEAKLLVSRLEERLKAVTAMIEARQIFNTWQKMQPMIAALAPEGCRAKRAGQAVAAFNERLAALCEKAKFPAVTLDTDLVAHLDGRPFDLLSESEQWRVDTMITLALAQIERPAFVVLDRMDLLVRDARPGVFHALLEVGLPAVVAMTSPDNNPGTLPNLRKAGVGRTYWMDDGELKEATA